MKLGFARKYVIRPLKQPCSHRNLSSSASFGRSFKAFTYSTSCQPSLEVGDNSAGDVHEESQIQQTGLSSENIEKTRGLELRTQPIQETKSHSELDQEHHLKGFPLKVVVQTCTKRWFKEHLRNAEKGDSDAQVMVGQMISHGYGVPRDADKGAEWIRRGCSRQKQSKVPTEKKKSEDEDLYFM